MGMVAILVMWPGPFEQTFVTPSHRSSIWNLTLIGPVVYEIFKECGRRTTTDIKRTTEAYLSYKLTNGAFVSGELKIHLKSDFFYNCFHDFIHVYSPGIGADNPLWTHFDVNRKILSLRSFVASLKKISLKSDFIQFVSWFYTCI